jgi:hypothetical protein
MLRAVVIGGCAVGLVVGSLSVGALATSAPALACPYGTVASHFSGVCVSGPAGGGAPQAVPPQTGNSGANGAQITQSVGGLQTVNGIPCTPQHLGTCIGLIQSQGH